MGINKKFARLTGKVEIDKYAFPIWVGFAFLLGPFVIANFQSWGLDSI